MSGSESATGTKKRVFSGMQPSGEAHLGNYLGAFKRWVSMQDEYDCIWCIVDDHAITSGGDPALMPDQILDLAVSFLAVGLDPERAIIFVQSDVHEHTELAWLLNAVTPVGDLERMTQYKDKASRFESLTAGFIVEAIRRGHAGDEVNCRCLTLGVVCRYACARSMQAKAMNYLNLRNSHYA